ncbi:hypothetical protein TNCV_1328781 [Trichonephila clavipes]|nr:hypothetical protein TNCV_1328781 [Trichonephila clavipes]
MWSMVAQRLTQITPPAATPDQLWQRVEAAWSAVPQELIQSLFESMPRLRQLWSKNAPIQEESSVIICMSTRRSHGCIDTAMGVGCSGGSKSPKKSAKL